jgi:GPI ethanolamine phosphate transferase 3 subunit O
MALSDDERSDRAKRMRRLDILAILLALTGLYWFAASFFLAKRSLPDRSSCDEAATLLMDTLGLTRAETEKLQQQGILSTAGLSRRGCWMNRVVDSVVILVVDALRFDFAYYNLPNSVGKRLTMAKLYYAEQGRNIQDTNITTPGPPGARLFQFVADPPTVTMQRLKALTTGGLPTFADISANFGGATVEEDNWVQSLVSTDWRARGLLFPARLGFVGDDTWEDLYPGVFHESYPYPSFNTRDMNTVDNGCIKHIPALLNHLRKKEATEQDLEVMVVHFLGVDHVGHTYGPHNEHMDAKLRQIDDVLSNILEQLEASDACHATYIFGDHGMTEEGNHGGGTPEETNAALFVHSSPACGPVLDSMHLEQTINSGLVDAADFSSIHQIDLVPTIATVLGLPIPYANLGSFVPSLVPGQDIRHATAALALNAAQVWRYFTVYSETANKLPNLSELGTKLHVATNVYKDALSRDDHIDIDSYQQAASLFKIFLREALDLGQKVWTRFDSVGMTGGICVLALGLGLYTVQSIGIDGHMGQSLSLGNFWELFATAVFMIYQCGVLSFSNSYILEESHSIMFSLSVLSAVVAFRLWSDPVPTTLWRGLMLVPIAARLSESLVSGHGLDPSIQLHGAHTSPAFLASLLVLGGFRWYLLKARVAQSFMHAAADCMALLFLGASWWEKRSTDERRDGFFFCRIALSLLFGGIPLSIFQSLTRDHLVQALNVSPKVNQFESDVVTTLSKVLLAIMAVTGPSAAPSLVLFTLQAVGIYALSTCGGSLRVHSAVIAALWKLVTRHVFFATNHGCAFNRLQYSAAFAATKEFYFVTGGISLFLNTFGWEVSGLVFAWLISHHRGRKATWRIYGIYQLIEAICSCLSVSLLRRHLMVWDIYAPHFLFTAIFSILTLLSQLTVTTMLDN